MLIKLCHAPQGGGTARGNIRYILGYELGSKEGAKERRQSFDAIMAEAMEREDFGVAAIWQPTAGGGKRPSSIFAYGVASLATADIEIQAVADGNGRLRSGSSRHIIFSFGQDVGITDEQMLKAVHDALLASIPFKLHYDKETDSFWSERVCADDELQYVASVHRDTANPHVHVALGNVSPITLRAHETWQIHHRLDRAARTIELAHRLAQERGLAVIRHGRVERSTFAERHGWRRAGQAQRIDDMIRHVVGDYAQQETPLTWCDSVLAPALSEAWHKQERVVELGPMWMDLHLKAATYGAQLVGVEGDSFCVQLLRRAESGVGTSSEAAGEVMAIPFESVIGVQAPGRTAAEEYAIKVRHLRSFFNLDAGETQFERRLRDDPGYVSRRIVADGKAVFTREDIDRYIGDRITDPDSVEDLSLHVERNDDTLRVLSPDADLPLLTTLSQLELEREVIKSAETLAAARDIGFRADALQSAILATEEARGYLLTAEQRAVAEALNNRFVWVQGKAGSGKSTTMEVIRRYGDATGRKVRGFTTAEAAARRLADEAGIESSNIARTEIGLAMGDIEIKDGTILILDETSMMSYDALKLTIDLATKHHGTIVAIGDAGQLPDIGPGSPSATLAYVAQRHGSYYEIKKVVRQRERWQAAAVESMDEAILHGDRDGVRSAVGELANHDCVTMVDDRDAAVVEAANRYLHLRAEHGSAKILGLASTKLDAKHANFQVRTALRGSQVQSNEAIIRTDGGYRYFAVGDPIMLTKNNKKLGVHNGDNGVVVDVSEDRREVVVEIPRLKTTLSLGSTYRSIEYGWFTTVHKAQGATVEAAVEIVNSAISAQMLYVAASRPRGRLDIIVPKSAFDSVEDFADKVASSKMDPKDDALLFKEIVDRFGGHDSVWAQRVRRAIELSSDPLRQQYEAALLARKRELENRKHLMRDGYRGRLTDPRVKAEFASRMKALAGEFKPPSFVTWCANHGPEITGKWVIVDDRAPHITRDNRRPTIVQPPRPNGPAFNDPHLEEPTLTLSLEPSPTSISTIKPDIGFESGARTQNHFESGTRT